MQIKTLGHASFCLKDDSGSPILLTDPWLIGSAYWRSWWLQNYPTHSDIEYLKSTQYIYLTHEHPDHLHIPSIRLLGKKPQYICPNLPNTIFCDFLRQEGFNSRSIESYSWEKISQDVSILSIPTWNGDSLLLVDTPSSFIININDTKPNVSLRKRLSEYCSKTEKKIILLSSYSPASIVNSFTREGTRISMKQKNDYVNYVCNLCDELKADFFMPFASQVVFLRSDSEWANTYKVTYGDLKQHWSSSATLVPPHTNLDFKTWQYDSIPEENYNSMNSDERNNIILAEEAKDSQILIDSNDFKVFQNKFSLIRFLLIPFFTNGIAFKFPDQKFIYYPLSGKTKSSYSKYSVEFVVPKAPFKDTLHRDQIGDLGIAMFTLADLDQKTKPAYVYGFLILTMLHDYEHLKTIRGFFNWVKGGFFQYFKNLPVV